MLWLRSWHPGNWQSHVFRSKLHNYIIAISKHVTVWLCHSQGQRLFSRGKFTEVSVRRADRRRFFFIINTWWVKVFYRWQTLFFGQKCDSELVGQTGGRMLLRAQFCLLPKTVSVTTLPRFGSVTLLCGTLLFIKLSEESVSLTDCTIDTPSICADGLSTHTGSGCQYCASDQSIIYGLIEMIHK